MVLALVVGANFAMPAFAHEVRPAYLEVKETQPSEFAIRWRQPATERGRLALDPVFPESCEEVGEREASAINAVYNAKWTIRCDLHGQKIGVKGLDRTLTDILLQVQFLDGETHSALLKPGAASYQMEVAESYAVPAYLQLGIEHILLGFDHLLFVLALVLLISMRQIVKVITAFTLAHSVTLAATALGWVTPISKPVEILIALSILLLAVEVVKTRGKILNDMSSLTLRKPWLIAAIFGLLHGFGFAGALSEIGLPEGSEIGALFLFNVGVEIGQLLFIAALLMLFWIGKRIAPQWADRAHLLTAYAVGAAGAYWVIDRIFG